MSKFDKVFEAREDQDKENKKAEIKNNAVKNKVSNSSKQNNSSPSKKFLESPSVVTAEPPNVGKQRGRPKAKRSDPAFIGFTTYIRKDTHLKVKIALLQEGKGREMSELVEDLLSNWTKNK